MRIGLDLRMAGEDFGIGRYSLSLVRHILEQDRENEFFLFVRDPAKFQKVFFAARGRFQLVAADFRHYSFGEQYGFLRLLNRYNLDLVHFLNFNVPVFYRGDYVVTIHDVVHHRLPGNKPSRFLHRMAYKYVISQAAKNAKKIITVSNFSKQDIQRYLKVRASKIKVVYEAAEVMPVSESQSLEVLQRLGISKKYILFVGVMERKKNIANLVKGFDLLKEKFQTNIQLVLVGKEDPHYPEVMRRARSAKYAKDLIITGPLSDKDKFALYKMAQAFVSASLYEGFGLPGLEAMSVGVPLIVSNTEVFNEIYDNGAIYFDPLDTLDIAQKINLLLGDDKYRELIAGNAYKRSQQFSWQRTATQTLEVYRSISR